MKPYLKIHIEVAEPDRGNEGAAVAERRVYPAEFARHDSYHTFITYEVLDMMSKIRKALP